MMEEERVRGEIEKLEQSKINLFAQLKQVEGALAAMRVVLDPGVEAVEAVEVEGA
jgi:hypothetical protein